jgi:hypothetical protein
MLLGFIGVLSGGRAVAAGRVRLVALRPLAADNRANAVARGMSRELNAREVEAPNFGSARGIEALKTMQD